MTHTATYQRRQKPAGATTPFTLLITGWSNTDIEQSVHQRKCTLEVIMKAGPGPRASAKTVRHQTWQREKQIHTANRETSR